MKLEKNYSLKHYNTFHVDSTAKLFVEVNTENELKEALKFSRDSDEQFFVLGGGSNTLFKSDFNGVVIRNSLKGIEIIKEDDEYVYVKSGAGDVWNDLVNFAVVRNYGGIENLALIPGTVGAAPIQNIGAYGAELKDCFHSLEGLFVNTLAKRVFKAEQCKFGYRDSIFKGELKGKFIITNVTLKLMKKPEINLSYKSLSDAASKYSEKELTISKVKELVNEIRKSKLPDPDELGNAGSFFKNPEIDLEIAEEIKKNYPDLNYYKIDSGKVKISAGWLIDKAGYKGKRKGNVGSYDKQALVIVNYGGASGEDVLKYSRDIQKKVLSKFRIELIYEVNILQ